MQRAAVVPHKDDLNLKSNPNKIGFYKRAELNQDISMTAQYGAFEIALDVRDRVARIYQPTMKHVHDSPANKTVGKTWVVEFESKGMYKSNLMFWTSGTQDAWSGFRAEFMNLQQAMDFCK